MQTSIRTPDAALPAIVDDLIVLTDAAMGAGAPERIVPRLVDGLDALLRNVGPLPAEWLRVDPAGYGRRSLYRSPRFGYEVLAMTWGAGQGSSIHDHADTWGVEAVLQGALEVVDYRVTGRERALQRLAAVDRHVMPAGAVIGLLPPHDLHACRNPGAVGTTVTLHVYGRELDVVKRYAHVEGDLYRPQRVHLTTA